MTHWFDDLGHTVRTPAFELGADGRVFTPDVMQPDGPDAWRDGDVHIRISVHTTPDGSRAVTLQASGLRHVTEVCLLDAEISPAPELHNHIWFDLWGMQRSTAVFARGEAGGFFACYANPFGMAEIDGPRLRLSYRPAMDVHGEFVSDPLIVGRYERTGRTVRRELLVGRDITCGRLPGYGTTVGPLPCELDSGEIAAVRRAVAARIPWEPQRAFVSHWDWSENLFRLQIYDEQTRRIYSRSAQICAEMGVDVYLVSPGGSFVFPDPPPTDIRGEGWGDAGDAPWQRIMWLGMGMEFARNDWEPGRELPGTLDVLEDIRSRGLTPVPYVNPQYPWELDESRYVVGEGDRPWACLGHPGTVDWLLDNGSRFLDQYGLGGMSWDFVVWWECNATDHGHDPGPDSLYAQWDGYRRALAGFRARYPDTWIETLIGSPQLMPWGSRDMTMPCGVIGDNQPQWIPAWPDLSTARVHAHYQRRAAFWYRNFGFTPSYKIPGQVLHQSNRIRWWTPERGWDWEGSRYNLLSAIATAPSTMIMGFVPCWDHAEFEAVRERDVGFFRRWIDWAKDNHRVLAGLEDLFEEPRPGAVDGTIARDEDGTGFVFLCNPDFDPHVVDVPGVDGRLLRELHPEPGRLWEGRVEVEPHEVHVLELIEPSTAGLPLVLGVAGRADADGLIVSAVGRPGSSVDAIVRTASGDRRTTVAFETDGITPTLGPWRDPAGDEVDVRELSGHVDISCDWTPGPALPGLLAELVPGVEPIGDEVLNPWSDPSRLRIFPELIEPESAAVRMWVDDVEVEMKVAYVGTFEEVRDVDLNPMTNNMLGRYCDLTEELRGATDLSRPWRLRLVADLQRRGQFVGVRVAHLPHRTTTAFRSR